MEKTHCGKPLIKKLNGFVLDSHPQQYAFDYVCKICGYEEGGGFINGPEDPEAVIKILD